MNKWRPLMQINHTMFLICITIVLPYTRNPMWLLIEVINTQSVNKVETWNIVDEYSFFDILGLNLKAMSDMHQDTLLRECCKIKK